MLVSHLTEKLIFFNPLYILFIFYYPLFILKFSFVKKKMMMRRRSSLKYSAHPHKNGVQEGIFCVAGDNQ